MKSWFILSAALALCSCASTTISSGNVGGWIKENCATESMAGKKVFVLSTVAIHHIFPTGDDILDQTVQSIRRQSGDPWQLEICKKIDSKKNGKYGAVVMENSFLARCEQTDKDILQAIASWSKKKGRHLVLAPAFVIKRAPFEKGWNAFVRCRARWDGVSRPAETSASVWIPGRVVLSGSVPALSLCLYAYCNGEMVFTGCCGVDVLMKQGIGSGLERMLPDEILRGDAMHEAIDRLTSSFADLK